MEDRIRTRGLYDPIKGKQLYYFYFTNVSGVKKVDKGCQINKTFTTYSNKTFTLALSGIYAI